MGIPIDGEDGLYIGTGPRQYRLWQYRISTRSSFKHKSWWRHQMETFSALLAICAGNSPVPVNSPHKGQWRGALMFPLICVWINDWVNNREAGDLRRYRIHYDVIVMISWNLTGSQEVNNVLYQLVILILKATRSVGLCGGQFKPWTLSVETSLAF